MTAINTLASGPKAFIVSDTAAYDADGVVLAFASKVSTLPHVRMAVASRGAMAAVPTMAADLGGEFSGLDDLLKRGAEIVRDWYEEHWFTWDELARQPDLDLQVAGWSEKNRRAECHVLSSFAHPGMEPFTFQRHDLIMSPMLTADEMRAAGIVAPSGAILLPDPAANLLAVMKLQRSQPRPIRMHEPDGPAVYTVGGQCVLTVIDEHGISQRVLHRWADRRGELIAPDDETDMTLLGREQLRAREVQELKRAKRARLARAG